MTRLLPTALAFLLVAGCASPSAPDAGSGDPLIVTAPDDYAYLGQPNPMARPHLHDYWGGQTRKTLMDHDIEVMNFVVIAFPGGRHGLGEMRLADGAVVPQGTANVTITITHVPGPADRYGAMDLRVRTANGAGYGNPIPFTSGEPIRLQLGPDDADLPHQVLSAWLLDVTTIALGGPHRVSGHLHVTVEAERGLPIPTFPGHPDQWNGTSQQRLFQEERALQDLTPDVPTIGRTCSALPLGNCYFLHLPDDGVVVPYDAAFVEIQLRTMQAVPPGFALWFHGADTWDFTKLEPIEQSGDLRVYRVLLSGNGDGPYANRSLWEFMVVGEERTVEIGSYAIEATAFREDAIVLVGSGGRGREASPSPASRTMSDHGTPSALTSEVPGCLESQGGVRPTDERGLVVTPMSQFSLEVRGPAKDVRLVIALCSGNSLGATLDVPRGCRGGGTMSVHVIGFSSGQKVAEVRCPELPEGEHGFLIESGAATFTGEARLYGATFG